MDHSVPSSVDHKIHQARILEFLPLPSPGIFPIQESNIYLLCLQHWPTVSLPLVPFGKPLWSQFSSGQFCRSVMSDSLWPHGLQHARLPCPSPTPGTYSSSCPLSQWCHPTISSSVIPFSSCLQSFPTSGSFQMNQLFALGGQSIGVSASVLPKSIQDWFLLGWTGWISLQSKGLSRVFFNTTVQSINSSVLSFLYSPTLTSIHNYWKSHNFD